MRLEDLPQQTRDYSSMEAGGFYLKDVFEFGEKMAQKVNMANLLDLHDVVTGNGGAIHYINMGDFKDFSQKYPQFLTNSIYVHDKNCFDIILPMYASCVENQYTLAHELGHYVLHAKKKNKCYARRYGVGQIEQEALCFAIGFLMPRKIFNPDHERYDGHVASLANRFLVPDFVVESRIKAMSLFELE